LFFVVFHNSACTQIDGSNTLSSKKLSKGSGVRISHDAKLSQYGGGTAVMLTKIQHNRVMKNLAKGSGIVLRMSPQQIAHHVKYGGGVWDTIKNFAEKVIPVAKALYPVGKEVYNAYRTLTGKGLPNVSLATI